MRKKSKIKKDDYVLGYEYYGNDNNVRKTAGWVNKIYQLDGYTLYDIQADDSYGGARGTTLSTKLGKVEKLEAKDRPIRITLC